MSVAPLPAVSIDFVLVARFRAGDPRAFEAIHACHRPALERLAAQWLRGALPGPEDVVQESFARAHRALLADDEPVLLRPWLARIVRNACIDATRRPVVVALPPEALDRTASQADPAAAVSRREELRELVADLQALPERQRQALVGHVLRGCPHAEVAADLGVTPSASKMLVRRARRTLAARRDARGAGLELAA